MKATLTKIDQPRSSRNGGVTYQRLSFQLEDGSFAMTDLVHSFRNFQRWKPVIMCGIGTVVDGIRLLAKAKVDADSPVRIYQAKLHAEERPNV